MRINHGTVIMCSSVLVVSVIIILNTPPHVEKWGTTRCGDRENDVNCVGQGVYVCVDVVYVMMLLPLMTRSLHCTNLVELRGFVNMSAC